jgi:FHA domain/GAF domain
MPRLVINRTGESPRVYELSGDRPVSIGRAKSNNLVLDHGSVSRFHAVLHSAEGGRWQIIDRDSSNGVRVNGAATHEATLHPDDQLAIGEYSVQFEDSVKRKITTCGTAQFPPKFAKILSEAAYSGSFMSVEAIAELSAPEPQKRPGAAERLRALESENKLLALLYRLNQTLAVISNQDELNRRVLDFVLEIEGAERSYMMLLDEDSMGRTDLHIVGYNFQPAIIRYRSAPERSGKQATPQLAMSQTIIGQVMKSGLPLLIAEGDADPRFSKSKSVIRSGMQSAMCAPLGIGNRVRGLLYVDNLSRRGMFAVDDLNAFAVIAVQAGLAIERIRSRVEVPVPARS